MFCKHCGKELKENDKFCIGCGNSVYETKNDTKKSDFKINDEEYIGSQTEENKHKSNLAFYIVIAILLAMIVLLFWDSRRQISILTSQQTETSQKTHTTQQTQTSQTETTIDSKKETLKTNTLNKAESSAENGDYSAAATIIEEAIVIIGNDVELINKKDEYLQKYYDLVAEQLNKFIEKEEYEKAIDYCVENKVKTKKDANLDTLLEKIEGEAVNIAIEEATVLFNDKNYAQAMNLLNELLNKKNEIGMEVFSDKLNSKIEELEDRKPTPLNELHLIDSTSDEKYIDGAFVDSFGDTFDGRISFSAVSGSGLGDYLIYNLNGEYSTFTGSITACQSAGSTLQMVVTIYVDDELKYTSEQFGKTTGKIDFEINVKAGKKLKIKAEATTGYSSRENCAVVNAKVWK